MAQSQPRLDKNHGFLHHITRNQIDRRDYHEEKLKDQTRQAEHTRNRDRHDRRNRDDRRSRGNRRSAERGVEQTRKEYMDKPDKDGVVFSLTIEYCPDKIAVLKVKQRDDPDTIARQFTKQYGMREDLTLALSHVISQKMGLK